MSTASRRPGFGGRAPFPPRVDVRPILPLFLLTTLAASEVPAEVRWQPRATFEFGVDSFAQIYRLTEFASESLLSDESTLRTETDVFTELRGAAEFGLRVGDRDRGADLRTRFSAGTDTWRGDATFDVDLRDEVQRLDLQLDFEGRRFRDDTDYALSSDVGEGRLRAHWRWAAHQGWEVGLRTRGRVTRYEDPGEFEIDNERYDLTLTSQLRGGLGQWLDLEIGLGRRSVDDFASTSEEGQEVGPALFAYDRWFGLAEWSHDTAGPWRLALVHWIERRVYDDEEQRSSLLNLVVEPEVRLRVDEDWELRWRSAMEWLDYDESRDAYYDLALGRTGVAVARRWSTWEWSVEPRLSWLSAPAPNEDEYVQPSLVVSFDGFGGDRLFLSVSEELGHRDYREPLGGGLDLYSDYWFLRSTVLASYRISASTSVELFLSDEPESHRDEEDDARLTLVTATLRVRI